MRDACPSEGQYVNQEFISLARELYWGRSGAQTQRVSAAWSSRESDCCLEQQSSILWAVLWRPL